MRTDVDLPEPMADIGSWQYDNNLYGTQDRGKLQQALRTIYDKLCAEEVSSIQDLETFVREQGLEEKVVDDAFEIMQLPTEKVAWAQCWNDCWEEAESEERAVKDAAGLVNYDAIVKYVAHSERAKYTVKMKSPHFKENAAHIRTLSFDFTDKVEHDLKVRFKMIES